MNCNQIYVIGNNEYGQFGLKHKTNLDKLTRIKNHKFNIQDIHCGYNYSIYSNHTSQTYYSAGYNETGQCAIGNSKVSIKKLKTIDYFNLRNIQINKICTNVSGLCTFWITDNNKLYGNGCNSDQELGLPLTLQKVTKPMLLTDLNNVIDVQSADDYSIALCFKINLNKILSYFNYKYTTNLLIPNDIMDLIKIFYGHNHKVLATKGGLYGGNGHGNAYSNSHGKFGNKNVFSKHWQEIMTFQENNIEIVKIKTGNEHSLFLETNGVLWSSGYNEYGQLGQSDFDFDNIRPARPKQLIYFISLNIKIRDIACGCNHSLVIDENHKIYSFGLNNHGQCGDGLFFNISSPKLINKLTDSNIKYIKCGSSHSYAMTVDNKHYLWGSNKHKECLISIIIAKLLKFKDKNRINVPCFISDIVKRKTNGKEIKKVCLGYFNTTIIVEHA